MSLTKEEASIEQLCADIRQNYHAGEAPRQLAAKVEELVLGSGQPQYLELAMDADDVLKAYEDQSKTLYVAMARLKATLEKIREGG